MSVVIAHSAILYRGVQLPDEPRRPGHRTGRGRTGVDHQPRTCSPSSVRSTPRKVTDGLGKFYKSQGVTTVGAVGYSISPLSSEAAKASIASAKSQGLKVGLPERELPLRKHRTLQPVVLAMKAAGVNGFTATTDPNTAFALVTGLRQAGADVKVAIFSTGYGGDLLQAGPGALSAAQNVYFSLTYEPVEMNTSATKQFVSDLAAAGVIGKPTYAEYNGYVSIGLLVRALKATGGDTKASDLDLGAVEHPRLERARPVRQPHARPQRPHEHRRRRRQLPLGHQAQGQFLHAGSGGRSGVRHRPERRDRLLVLLTITVVRRLPGKSL